MSHSLRSDLAVVLRARATWRLVGLCTVVVGYGFARSVELARTRAAAHPLRPCLSAFYLALCIFGPVIAARALAMEKERRTFHGLLLQARSIPRVLWNKFVAATVGVFMSWFAVALALCAWCALFDGLELPQASATLLGYAIYSAYVATVGLAAAALTPTFRSAVLLSWFMIAWNAAIDVSPSVDALTWLRSSVIWAPGSYLARFEQGEVALGAIAWLITAIATGLVYGWCGCRFDLRGARRWWFLILATVVCGAILMLVRELPGSWDIARPELASDRH